MLPPSTDPKTRTPHHQPPLFDPSALTIPAQAAPRSNLPPELV